MSDPTHKQGDAPAFRATTRESFERHWWTPSAAPDNNAPAPMALSAEATDRELLEAAARAAGIVGEYVHHSADDRGMTEGLRLADDINYIWNPLFDGDDALELAVKLEMRLDFLCIHAEARTRDGRMTPSPRMPNDDGSAYARRAIVRAAAATAIKGAKP